MKISRTRLKEIITEELGKLREDAGPFPLAPGQPEAGLSTTALKKYLMATALDASTLGKMQPVERLVLKQVFENLVDAFDESGQQQTGRLGTVLTMLLKILKEFNEKTKDKPEDVPGEVEPEGAEALKTRLLQAAAGPPPKTPHTGGTTGMTPQQQSLTGAPLAEARENLQRRHRRRKTK